MTTQTLHCGDALELVSALPSRSVDLVFCSPPYENARTYEVAGDAWKFDAAGQAWCDWLAPIVAQCARASAGLVLVNASSVVRNHRYSAAVEWLVADLTRVHGLVCGPAPYAWFKDGIPGSGGARYHRRNWEPVYAFAQPDRLPLAWSDNLAFGKPPAFGPGGQPSHRQKDGRRVGSAYHGKRRPNGGVARRWYAPPAVANPGNTVRVGTGGGKLGGKEAHECEAPMPVALADRFIRWYCPPLGTVLDPFAGSGTTLVAAKIAGRSAVGIDVRPSMVAIAERRLAKAVASADPLAEVSDGYRARLAKALELEAANA